MGTDRGVRAFVPEASKQRKSGLLAVQAVMRRIVPSPQDVLLLEAIVNKFKQCTGIRKPYTLHGLETQLASWEQARADVEAVTVLHPKHIKCSLDAFLANKVFEALRVEVTSMWMGNQTTAGIDALLVHVRGQAELHAAEHMQVRQPVPKSDLKDPSPATKPEREAKPVPVCRQFKAGHCTYGAECRFRHERKEKHTPRSEKQLAIANAAMAPAMDSDSEVEALKQQLAAQQAEMEADKEKIAALEGENQLLAASQR